MKRTFFALLALVFVLSGVAYAQVTGTGFAYIPGVGYIFTSPVTIGAGGFKWSSLKVYTQTITPVATAAAIGTTSQTFTVTGLLATDKVFVNGPAPTSLCPLVQARASAANTLSLSFTTLTAAACTPASGSYNIVAIH